MLAITLLIGLVPTFAFANTIQQNNPQGTPEEEASVPEMVYFDDNGNQISNEENALNFELKNNDNVESTPDTVDITPNDKSIDLKAMLMPGPVLEAWDHYTVDSGSQVVKFKKICEATVDNRKAKKATSLTCKIERSAASSSTWNINLSAEYENRIIAKVGASYTKTKSTNAAVGLSSTASIPAGKQGKITAYYKGYKTTGYITYNLIQNNRIIGTKKENTTQTNHYKTLNVHFEPSVY